MKIEINTAKRTTFDDFIYKKEPLELYKFLNGFCSENCKTEKDSMKLNRKVSCKDDQIADAFETHFSSKQSKLSYMKQRDTSHYYCCDSNNSKE